MENTLKAMNLGSNKPAAQQECPDDTKAGQRIWCQKVANRSPSVLCSYYSSELIKYGTCKYIYPDNVQNIAENLKESRMELQKQLRNKRSVSQQVVKESALHSCCQTKICEISVG